MTVLIGIAGHPGAGKDTTAEYLQSTQGAWIFHFAGPLKVTCAAAFGISVEMFYDAKVKNEKIPFWGMSPREMAQFVGTELFRTHLRDDFWLKRMELQLVSVKDLTLVAIPDVRFQNEVDWIFAQDGYLIHIKRPGYDGNIGIANHASEAGFVVADSWKEGGRYFEVLNTGTIQHLHSQIHNIYRNRIAK